MSEYRDPRVDPRCGDVLRLASGDVEQVTWGHPAGIHSHGVCGSEWHGVLAEWRDRAQHAVVLWQDDAPPPADVALLASANRALAEQVATLTAERDEARRVLLALADALGCPVAHPDAMIASIRALREQVAGWISLGKSAGLRADRMTRERDEARAMAQPAWTDLDAVRSIIRFECEECGIEFPPEDADVPAQLRHLLGGRDAMEVALKAERDRFARVLAVERGDETAAPGYAEALAAYNADPDEDEFCPPWFFDGDWHHADSGLDLHRFIDVDCGVFWSTFTTDPDTDAWEPCGPKYRSALEAMEAIDAEVSRG